MIDTMTAAEQRELDLVRWKLERLVRRRVLSPLLGWEQELYGHLVEREKELLDAAA